jgi:ATP/maltotriose-dependent transcriptional regulator MalT
MIRPVAADGRIETGGAFTPILRPRVVDRIASAATQRIVLIVAPAGYGKSVALRQYLDKLDGVPHMRYDVREENGTLLGFVRGLAEAVTEIAPAARKTVSGAYEKSRSSKTPGLDLAMWMHAHIKTFTGVIAIDDLHIAENDPEISKFLVSLIDRTKGRARWIIASRSSLDLPVGSWLAYGEMDLNIDEQDLRFTIEEARETAKASRVSVRDEELAQILSMTEGWPTALSFALRTSTRSVDLRNIAATTREMVYRYLAEQVYHSIEGEQRELLHLIGYLPEIDLEVLRAAGYTKGKALVEDLRDRVAFIYPDRPGVYRCHDLFRDFLQHQVELEGALTTEQTARRAGVALEAVGQMATALSVFAEARATDDVLRILETAGFHLIEHGHADAVQAALEVLPQDLRATHAVVLGMRALGEAHVGRYDRAESLLNRALGRSENAELSAMLAVRLALIAINLGRDVVPLLKPFADDKLPLHLRCEALSLLAVAYANADRDVLAKEAIESVDELASELDDAGQRARVLQRLGAAAMRLAMPAAEAEQYLTRALVLANESGTFGVASRCYGVLANVALFYADDVTRSAWYTQQGMGAATKAGDRLGLQTALIQLMDVEVARGNAERLLSLERQFADAATSDATRMALIIPIRAALAAWRGRFDEAHRLLVPALERIIDPGDKAYWTAVCALALTVEGDRDRAAATLRLALELTEADTPYAYTKRYLQLARSICAAAEALSGRTTSANRILQRVSEEPSPVVCALRDAVTCLVRAVKNVALKDDVLERLQALDSLGYAGVRRIVSAAVDRCLTAESNGDGLLTPAEMAVLEALADGRGPKDIALETGRSVYTIQVHIKNIIKKLGCSGRNEALTVARRRGLLG